jgi:O-antigen/teichoic acid export membrane protein
VDRSSRWAPQKYGRKALREWARRITGFALIPAVSTLSPILALPFLTRMAGAEGWAAIATGQAIGAAAGLFVQFGWGTTGPSIVATLKSGSRRSVYFTSVLMRLTLFMLTTPLALLATAAIVPSAIVVESALLCAAAALGGLSPNWYFVGTGRPAPLMWFETVPRLGGVVVSTVLMVSTDSVLVYATMILAIETAIVTVSAVAIARPQLSARAHISEAWHRSRQQWHLAAAALVSSGYTRLSVPLVSIVAMPHAPVFASSDRIQGLGRAVIRPFVQAFQGWVSEPSQNSDAHRRRFLIASVVVLAATLVVSVGIVILLPLTSTLLFGPDIQISYLQASFVAVALVAVGLSNCTSNFWLVPTARIGTISVSTIGASIVGVPLVCIGAFNFGADGALAAIALVEVAVLSWQVHATMSALRA